MQYYGDVYYEGQLSFSFRVMGGVEFIFSGVVSEWRQAGPYIIHSFNYSVSPGKLKKQNQKE